jgi:hypothetical protein
VSGDLREQLKRWRADHLAFRREAIPLEDGRPFGDRMDTWQVEDFIGLDTHRHAYLERPRGHSKTGDLGTEAVKELILGPPRGQLYCVAVDEDQARLLFNDVADKFRRSPILRPCVKITAREITVTATGSKLTVLTSDAPSAWGLRPDWIGCDELDEWTKRDLWDSLWSATGKRPQCRMLVIATAGWDRTSIAWEVRQIAEREPDWYASFRGQCASWINPGWLEQQRRTLPAHVFARLHESRWVEAVGAFLTAQEVGGVFVEDAPSAPASVAVGGLDLGLTKDRSVAAWVEARGGVVWVRELRTWYASGGVKVDLQQVEAEVRGMAQRAQAPVAYNPWQAALLGQRLQAQVVRAVPFLFTAENRCQLFATLLDLIRKGVLKASPHEELRRELFGLEVSQTASGYRVDHRSGRHDDHVVAVGLAAQLVYRQLTTPCPNFSCDGTLLLSDDEAPQPAVTSSPVGTVCVAPTSDDYARDYQRYLEIRQKPLSARTDEEAAWLDHFARTAPPRVDAFPERHEEPGDLATALAKIRDKYQHWR